MFDQSKVVVISKGKIFAYLIDIVSFAGGVFSMPYLKDLVTPYLTSYTWAVVPAAFIMAWLAYRYVVTNIIYVLLAQVMK